jgi:hypothetical protein
MFVMTHKMVSVLLFFEWVNYLGEISCTSNNLVCWYLLLWVSFERNPKTLRRIPLSRCFGWFLCELERIRQAISKCIYGIPLDGFGVVSPADCEETRLYKKRNGRVDTAWYRLICFWDSELFEPLSYRKLDPLQERADIFCSKSSNQPLRS